MKTPTDPTLIHDLHDLIAALDRRVPHIERAGERAIARDAAALKVQALKRIAELQRSEAGRTTPALSGRSA